MPTHEEFQSFLNDWKRLTVDQKRQFHVARRQMVADLRAKRPFFSGLRVTRVQKAKTQGVWEMTWAPDGRATFMYGKEIIPGEAHIIWRRIGGHEIFAHP